MLKSCFTTKLVLLTTTMIQFDLDRETCNFNLEPHVHQVFEVPILGPTIVEAASNAGV